MKTEPISAPFATGTCQISDDWSYRNMRVIRMENDFLKIGILADRGSDIFEFRYKPQDLDFMLRLSKGIRNPQQDFSQMRDTPNQFEDYYYGGWQEILPNSPAFVYRGASLGQHGEVSLTPWKYSILSDSPERIAVKMWTRPVRMPVKIEKILSMTHDKAALYIEEQLTNESRTDLDIIWGHHIAFGLPFLKDGGQIETNAGKIISEPAMPDHRRFKPGIETGWPDSISIKGKKDRADTIPPAGKNPYSELSYLSGFGNQGRYILRNPKGGPGFQVNWDARIFKYLWFWQERFATQDAPWWGDVYAVALEPWTSMWRPDPQESIKNGEWLKLKPGVPVRTKLDASVVAY